MKIKLEDGAKMPTKAHESDAGWDLYCLDDFYMHPLNSNLADENYQEDGRCDTTYRTVHNGHKLVDTGVSVAIPEGFYGRIASKSGLSSNGIEVGAGVIDSSYRGTLKIILRNFSDTGISFHKGEKIAQLIIQPISTEDLELVEELDETDRGQDGFGSTGST